MSESEGGGRGDANDEPGSPRFAAEGDSGTPELEPGLDEPATVRNKRDQRSRKAGRDVVCVEVGAALA